MDGSVGLVNNPENVLSVVKPTTARSASPKPRETSLESTGTARNNRDQATGNLSEAVTLANSIADSFDKKITFSYDDRINRIIVKVIRESTEEVIREIPPQQMVELMAKLREDFHGLVLNQTG